MIRGSGGEATPGCVCGVNSSAPFDRDLDRREKSMSGRACNCSPKVKGSSTAGADAREGVWDLDGREKSIRGSRTISAIHIRIYADNANMIQTYQKTDCGSF